LDGNIDWGLVLGTISAVFTFVILLTQYYSRVYVPRRKDKEEKRNTIYKPLLMDIGALIEKVRKREVFNPPFEWKSVEGKVSAQLYSKLQELFQEKTDNYHKWLKNNQDFIRFKGYFYLKSNLSDLEKEFLSLGEGALEYELYNSITSPVLEGEKVSLKWIEDNRPEFYERLTKCPSHKKLKTLLNWLNEENPSVVSLRKAEQDLLQLAENLRIRIGEF